MMFAIIIATLLAIPLLGLATFVQLLYLESLRLRTRDLPSLKFFKDELEDKIGIKADQGAGSFSLIKHSLLIALGVLYCAWLGNLWEAALAAWLVMIAVAYALPQLLYRRTSGRWLLSLTPLLRALAWIARLAKRCSSFSNRSSISPTTNPLRRSRPPQPRISKRSSAPGPRKASSKRTIASSSNRWLSSAIRLFAR